MTWEIEFLNWLQGMRCPVLDYVFGFLSFIGEAGAFWIIVSIVLLFPKKTRRMGLQALIAMALTYIVGNLIMKPLIHRARPWTNELAVFDAFPAIRIEPKDYSFPSGHTMNGITCALTFLYNDKRFGIPALILALSIAFSRMYNYCHFPTDILGGIVIGILSSVIVHIIFCYFVRRMKDKNGEFVA